MTVASPTRAALRGYLIAGAALLALVVIAGLLLRARLFPVDEYVEQARRALEAGDLSTAQRVADRVLSHSPAHCAGLVIAGSVAEQRGEVSKALSYYDRIKADGSLDCIVGLGAAGDLLVKQGRLSEAEQRFASILRLEPNHTMAHRRLAALFVAAGRRRDSAVHHFELLKHDQIELDELMLLGDLEQIFHEPELLERFHDLAPTDPLPLLGLAKIALRNSDQRRAAELLLEAKHLDPDDLEIHASLGQALVGTDLQQMPRWHAALPSGADQHPDIWCVRAQWAQIQGDLDGAVRCYWEAVRLDPNCWRANYHLSQILLATGHRDSATVFYERAASLGTLVKILTRMHAEGEQHALMLKAAELTESLGRIWEAWAWYDAILQRRSDFEPAWRERKRLEQRLAAEMPRTVASANPAQRTDLSSYAFPAYERNEPTAERFRGTAAAFPQVVFADQAAVVGLDFRYVNGDDAQTPGMRTWQTFGGGVAILDFDNDALPDIYFTQGGNSLEHPAFMDCLFRNDAAGRFKNVTRDAAIVDNGFGQGIAVGDVNDDGFADVYVANIGRNRLHVNRGDGTFGGAPAERGLDGNFWTSSCAIADLNDDGFPEIYAVGYLAGRTPFERVCNYEKLGLPYVCPPTFFDGEQDRLFLNRADSTFQDVSDSSGAAIPAGKGLGIAVGDFDESGALDAFVANDTTENFLFMNESPAGNTDLRLAEQAVLRGCAYDFEGRRQACMGIAVDDANSDGWIDLYVTNYYDEYNVFYANQSGTMFWDSTVESGLKEPSVKMLGFGTQFIDGELDGWPDLVVVNGHVDDYRLSGTPFRMRPQYYRNHGKGRFSELEPAALGEFFRVEALGRSLARLDWNRDGREDFVVSHLDTPAALVENQTPNAGHFLALQLRGIESSRDAIGTTVRVTAGGRTRVRQLTAGDGYYASNQRQLVFGLGSSEQIDRVTVRWPSGLEQAFAEIPMDSELLLREGAPGLLRIP